MNASSTPKLKSAARNATSSSATAVTATSPPTAITTIAAIDAGAISVRRPSRPNGRGSMPCSPSEYARRPKPENGRRRRGEQDQRAGDADEHAQGVGESGRKVCAERVDDAEHRREQPGVAELGAPLLDGERRQPDDRDRDVERDDDADRAQQAAPDVDAGTARLLREVGNRLEPRVREHRERQREREVRPAGLGADRHPFRQRVGREQEREPEHDDEDLGHEVEHGDGNPDQVQPGAPEEADERDARDHEHADDDVPRAVVERVDLERPAEVVRQEERRERDHDHVVEEQHPAGAEAGKVVERLPHEGRRAARLRDRRRPLRIRERDEEEQEPGDQQHFRRQPERVAGDDPEREVDRRRDLAVRDGEEHRRAERALEHGQLARHQRPPFFASER